MTTSWRDVYERLKMNGLTGAREQQRPRGGSDESIISFNSDADTVTSNSSNTPQFAGHNRSSFDNEWQMNYMVINRRDGLKVYKRKKVIELMI